MLQNRMGCIIPCYTNPSSPIFNTIIQQKQAKPNVPIAVVLNPTGSGVGDAAQSAYTTLMDNLRSAGVIVLGYVYTNFGEEAESVVRAEIDKWWNFYNNGTTATTRRVHGIFFAAMSNQTAKQTYYSNLHSYARITKGFITTCGGAGNHVPQAFFGSVCADTIIVYEGAGYPTVGNYSQYDALADNNVALIIFGTSVFSSEWTNQISAYAGWVYITSDSGINPYDTLPSYFPDLITRLDAIGAGLSTGSNTDTFGIRKIYHTKSGGEEWYVNMADPTSDPRFQNEPALTRNADGSWSLQGSSGNDYQVRIEGWSPAYADTTQRRNARWLNVEITGYMRCDEEFMITGSYLFQVYSRGGHHTGTGNRCEGSALKAALWRRRISDSDSGLGAGFRKEVCHAAYNESNRGVVRNAVPWTSTGFYNRWIGFKHIIYNVVQNGTTYPKEEMWLDRNVSDGSGNLTIQNNWALVTQYTDTGGWCANQSQYDRDCGGCSYSRCQILTAAGGNTTSGSSNYNRNLVAWRTDGVRWRFKFLTAREIDPTKPTTGGGDPTPPVIDEPASAFDPFGVRKLFPSKVGGSEWYLASSPGTDARFVSNVTLTQQTDGSSSWRATNSPFITLQVYQPNGYNPSLSQTAAQNHGQCALNGYMQDNRDWCNVEMTGYVRINSESTSSAGELCWFARGGQHRDPQPWCEGSSMKGFLASNGNTRFAKEQYHIAYHYTGTSNQLNQSLVGKWVGFKYILFNRLISGQPVVKQQIYVDQDNTNTWILVDERNDAGGWGINGKTCNGFTDDQQITWAGPICVFRADNFSSIDFKWLSVREIEADAIASEPPPSQPGGSCGS